jgi:hypothetical protein
MAEGFSTIVCSKSYGLEAEGQNCPWLGTGHEVGSGCEFWFSIDISRS